jgi:hypothetical protein
VKITQTIVMLSLFITILILLPLCFGQQNPADDSDPGMKNFIAYIQQSPPGTIGTFGTVKVRTRSSVPLMIGLAAERRRAQIPYTLALTGPFVFEDGSQQVTGVTQGRAEHILIYFSPMLPGVAVGRLTITGPTHFDAPLTNPLALSGQGSLQ